MDTIIKNFIRNLVTKIDSTIDIKISSIYIHNKLEKRNECKLQKY